MDYKNVLEILDNSFSYLDYRITYNELIENGTLNTSQLTKDERIIYFKKKNEIRGRFYEQFKKDNPDEIVRDYLVYVNILRANDFKQNEFVKFFDEETKPIIKQYYLNERIKKLQ